MAVARENVRDAALRALQLLADPADPADPAGPDRQRLAQLVEAVGGDEQAAASIGLAVTIGERCCSPCAMGFATRTCAQWNAPGSCARSCCSPNVRLPRPNSECAGTCSTTCSPRSSRSRTGYGGGPGCSA